MQTTIDFRLDQLSNAGKLGDNSPCKTISGPDVVCLAEETGMSGRLVEIAALKRGIIPDRYLRNRKTFSEKDQIRLLEASVCVVGLGGLGGLVTETLSRMGVGQLTLVDGDIFEAHNLNRQLFSSSAGIGTPKAEAAAIRVAAINPGIEVTVVSDFLTSTNATDIVNTCHLVVDCLDNIPSRFMLESAARQAGIPMISAAVAGLSGHVTTIFPEDIGIENIYGPQDQVNTVTGAEAHLGCLAPGVNLIASIGCAEALKVLLAKASILRNRLLVVDLTDYTFETLKLF